MGYIQVIALYSNKVVRNPSMRYANIVPTVSSSLRPRLNVVQFIIVLLILIVMR